MADPAKLPGVASLWIGNSLGWIEALCLKSFLDQGQPVTLFTYAPVGNVPAGVVLRDARDVWTPPKGLLKATGASYIADIFRIHLMMQTDLIWVDCDAFCLKPFVPDAKGYLVGYYHGRGEIANGVMRLPKDSAALRFMSEIWNDPDFIPPWIRPALRQRLEDTPKDERLVKKFQVKRTIIGPRALTYCLRENDEIDHVLHERVLYPVPWEFADLFFNPHGGVQGWIAEDTISVHLYGSQIRPRHKNNPPHPDSFIGKHVSDLGVQIP